MKTMWNVLPLVALATAFVVPSDDVFAQIPIEDTKTPAWNRLPSLDKIADGLKKPFEHAADSVPQSFDEVIAYANRLKGDISESSSPFDFSSWIEESLQRLESGESHGPPPHGPPPHGPPGKGKLPHWMPRWPGHHEHDHDKHDHHDKHHHHHHGPPNRTIYELISKSNYTTNLTKLIDEDKDLVKLLNGTKANYTIFAPTDYAFSKIPHHGDHKPSKEIIKKVLLYHILPDLYPAFKLLFAHTAPTLLEPESLGGHPQRVLVKWLGLLRGVRVNYYDKIIAANIPASNGLIHATSSILIPPPPAIAIISHLPNVFSTFELALYKTGLYDSLNTTGKDTVGGTLFAPTNTAFKKLGPRANGFLFSSYGTKYLKALLEYHVVPKRTLYSTAFYDGKKDTTVDFFSDDDVSQHHGCHKHNDDVDAKGGYVHIDLPTALGGKTLSIDIIRRGPFIEFKINAFVRVAVQDGLAKDGVIQVVNDVLLPPKKPGEAVEEAQEFWNGEEEISVDELVARLQPFVDGQKEEFELFEGVKLDL